MMNVSPRSVRRAKKVKSENPEAHKAAKQGIEPKKPATSKRTSYIAIGRTFELMTQNPAARQRQLFKNSVFEIDPTFVFQKGGLDAVHAKQLEAICEILKARINPGRCTK